MDDKKEIDVETLRKKVCEQCRSRSACKLKPDNIILNCPVVNTYVLCGTISYPTDDWYNGYKVG